MQSRDREQEGELSLITRIYLRAQAEASPGAITESGREDVVLHVVSFHMPVLNWAVVCWSLDKHLSSLSRTHIVRL